MLFEQRSRRFDRLVQRLLARYDRKWFVTVGQCGCEQFVDHVTHAEGPVLGRFDQSPCRVRHLPSELIQGLVAEVGDRRQRRFQVVRSQLRELAKFGVCLPVDVKRVPQIAGRLSKIGVERQADVQKYRLHQRGCLIFKGLDVLRLSFCELLKAVCDVLIERPKEILRFDAHLGMDVSDLQPLLEVGPVPIRFEHRLEMLALHLLETFDDQWRLQELGRFLEGE